MPKTKLMGDILNVIKGNDSFIISSHINPDGDAVGSQLAVYSLLKDLEKSVCIVNRDPIPFIYKFLLENDLPYISLKDMEMAENQNSWMDAQVAIVLDCASLARTGDALAEKIRKFDKIINIDHHASKEEFGHYNLIDPEACATAELIFDLMSYGDIRIGRKRADYLYTAILTDTGSFRYGNSTPKAHDIASRMIKEGVNPQKIAELVYEVIPYQQAKLFGMSLDTLEISTDGKIAQMWVTNDMMEKTGTTAEDTEDFIDYVRSLRGVEIALFFRETEGNNIKASLRSKNNLDVSKVAAVFGGGGHKAAAGCTIQEPIGKARKMVVDALKKYQHWEKA
ncbi:bifunctional oligoribonuclease/PAP phosphatase NrnA [Candidatus Poribacteria bacterium]|nr:bifunctional oligoribonuclease/PAP phosphatase NrnA [Candidatus Poribacteria bacterium]